ncbi:2-phospho-L-lactate guanylyltransferase [Roseovarius amoyensis]|uniref:2-phospho-L-lactate guanylyltransferase n=1 Tax=Roseovarius amoyensis TaxID=2211448 RepID=UPI000DBE29D7|nr:2-phospho-L-lactate guanylyltransferase [Roseovarius amoyensis]
MTEIIIPVKELSCAKQRLMGVLSAAERTELVLAMLQDLLTAVAEADCGPALVVASNDAVFDIARKFAARPVREHDVRGYNAAVSLGFAEARGGNVAVLPADIPLAAAAEIRCLCAPAAADSRRIRLAASLDRMGTNGLFLASPGLILPGFGLNSFSRYRRVARAAGIEPTLIDAPGLACDIDTPHDLLELTRYRMPGATFAFLQGVQDRLKHSSYDRERHELYHQYREQGAAVI